MERAVRTGEISEEINERKRESMRRGEKRRAINGMGEVRRAETNEIWKYQKRRSERGRGEMIKINERKKNM